jgi:hypothetical protein
MVGVNKEGSGQEQTTTNHCALKADEQAGYKKWKDDANEEDERRGGGRIVRPDSGFRKIPEQINLALE